MSDSVLMEELRRQRARRLEAASQRLRDAVDAFLAAAAEGKVKTMLGAGVQIQADAEEVAKVVTGTEAP